MKLSEFVQGNPIAVQRSMRGDNVRALTSCQPGKVVPLAYFPLLREDAIRSGQVGVTVRMAETLHPILNAVNVRLYAHLVPWSAFPRFEGMDDFNRSYAGEGDTPFFDWDTTQKNTDVMQAMGLHFGDGPWNRMPLEAYNLIVNWRRKVRSKHLPIRNMARGQLARAFWSHPILFDVVPDYEQALLDGEVPLGVNLDSLPPDSQLRVSGIAYNNLMTDEGTLPVGQSAKIVKGLSTSGGRYEAEFQSRGGTANIAGNDHIDFKISGTTGRPQIYAHLPDIFAEMRQQGLSVSLSNFELAKQTVAFAKLRQQYQGIPEDHLIDLLMDGTRIPPESLRQPVLLGRASGVISMTERHATDGENLDMSRTTGSVTLGMRLRCPPINTGGIVLITAEITPEPLFERLGDKFLTTQHPDELPQFLRDYLDPRKVELVENREIDVLHSDPDGLFGYRGLNRAWDRDFTRAGGKFMRPASDAFKEDRQRFWVVETIDPTLTEDFYLVSSKLKNTPFADQNADPFEILTVSHQQIEGNTVFGKALHEDTGDYQAIIDRVVEKENP